MMSWKSLPGKGIIGITETTLMTETSTLEGYTLFLKDRFRRKVGGIVLYIKNTYIFKEAKGIKEAVGPLLNSRKTLNKSCKEGGDVQHLLCHSLHNKLNCNQTHNKDYLDKEADKLRDEIKETESF